MDHRLKHRLEHIDRTALNCPSATKDFKVEWEATRYQIGGKLFAMIGANKTGETILTVKSEPFKVEQLIEMYPYVTPGYYMNKRHWVSLLLREDIPDHIVEDVLIESYQLVTASLPKTIRSSL